MGAGRVLGDVVFERMPESLRAIAEEAESGVGVKKDKLDQGTGMPGQKKRKVAELAEGIDRELVLDGDVESVSLDCCIGEGEGEGWRGSGRRIVLTTADAPTCR